IRRDDVVTKYGVPIGRAMDDVRPGDWIHSHNLKTSLSGLLEYRYEPGVGPGDSALGTGRSSPGREPSVPTFKGYRRRNGKVGTRNELWVLNTVGCVNHAAER